MKFTFNVFDYDRDGFITVEDIRFILSHIPFVRSADDESPQSL